jgi:hypothetical protein
MKSLSVLPSRWTEVLNRMQKTVEQWLAAQCPPGPATSPPPTARPVSLPSGDDLDAAIRRAGENAAEAEATLQEVVGDLDGWLGASRQTGQTLADHLQQTVE